MFKDLSQRKIGFIEIALFFFSLILTGILLQVLSTKWWFYLVLIPIVLLGWHYYQEIDPNWRVMLLGAYSGIFVRSILKIIHIISNGFINPPEWDFVAFWLDGRMARQGLNFYLPSNYLNYELPVKISQNFTSEMLKVGFDYPPPTMLIFFPLGWFANLNYAYLIWQLLIATTIGIAIFLLWKLFLEKDNRLGLLVSGALVLLFPATYTTVADAQTNFMVLIAILLFISYFDSFSGGIWLSVGFLIKPYVGLLLLFSMIRRQWRTVISSIVAYGLLSLATIILFGFTTFNGYFTDRPISRMPVSIYTEDVNQSLLAQILRLTHYDISGKSPLFNPTFILLAIFLLSINCLLAFSIYKEDSIWLLILTLLTALLIYPGTLIHYSVMLILPMFIIWNYRNKLPLGLPLSVLVITATYLLILKDGDYIFIAITLNWLIFTIISSWKALVRFSDIRRTSLLSKKL